jgi:hypothetical protein
MTTAIFGLLFPVAAVWVLLLALRLRQAGDSRLVTFAIALCCALGLSSALTFCWAVLGFPIGPRFVGVDVLVWAAVGQVSWRVLRRANSPAAVGAAPRRPDAAAPRLTAADWLVRAAFVTTAAIAVATAVSHYAASPHGEWDAWAIWNQKARFLLRDIDHWTDMLAIEWSNPSHPLLVSLSVARLWAYAGSETTLVPALVGLVWAVGIVAAVMGALDTRNRRAWIAGCVVVAPGALPQLAAAQTADLAVSLFVVVTLVMLRTVVMAAADARATRAGLLLAGLVAGAAAWTKNEGLLLIGVSTLIVVWVMVRRGRPLAVAWWLGGAVPVGLAVFWLKLVIAPVGPEYMSEMAGPAALMERALDPARHALIAGLTGRRWVTWGGPFAAGALLLTIVAAASATWTRAGQPARVMLPVVVAMFAGYYAMWVLSPLDTPWLIGTTFDRLLMQLWPSLVLVAFSAVPPSRDDRSSPASVALPVGPQG